MLRSFNVLLAVVRILSLTLFPENGRINTFKKSFRNLKNRLYHFRHEKNLDSMTDMEQFRNYTRRVQYPTFLRYQRNSPQNRLDFQSFVSELGLNLKGIKFLDIGPGYGDSLDICYERGAKCIEFVDIDPFVFTHNRLKGFTKGYRVNLLTELNKLDPGKYDLIWVKGSISPDFFISINKLKIKGLSLSHWLAELEKLASPTCRIIICPFWQADINNKRNIEDVEHNWFTETMIIKGYVVLPGIKNHNYEPNYLTTFYKDMSRFSF